MATSQNMIIILALLAAAWALYKITRRDAYDNEDQEDYSDDDEEDYTDGEEEEEEGYAELAPADRMPQAPGKAVSFGEFAPKLQGQNFLNTTKFVGPGIDTKGSSLRNASLDLRASPPIPRNDSISPWMKSTIDSDLLRKPLE